jgi:hypothetical protein
MGNFSVLVQAGDGEPTFTLEMPDDSSVKDLIGCAGEFLNQEFYAVQADA